MDKRTINRRDFLKLLGASATAVGLSHFQFLNLGVRTAFAEVPKCGDADGDQCDPTDPDVCIEPSGAVNDVCGTQDPLGGDICGAGSPDECITGVSADICAEAPGENPPDICQPPPGDPDGCEYLQSGQPETPDTCNPPENVDVCPDGAPGAGGDGDKCGPVSGGVSDPDTCEPWMTQSERDICDPAIDPVDVCEPNVQPSDPPPTAVRLASYGARPAAGTAVTNLPMLGGVAAGAAVAWVLRRRMKHTQDEDDAA